jgi:hypothetical protein
MQLIKYKKTQFHVSQDTVSEFENAILAGKLNIYAVTEVQKVIAKIFIRLNLEQLLEMSARAVSIRKKESKLCILLGDEFHKAIIPFMGNDNNNCYFFDAWPSNHVKIEKFIETFKLKNVFFSSKQVVAINSKNINCKFHWIPEAIQIENYEFKDYQNKDIDVLSFGRKFNRLHESIVDGLEASKIAYYYEKSAGEIIFSTRSAFIDGLARTKISVCIPSNITHPERAGTISTMTIRYLQSMASKCLIIGYLPEEMKELFNYNPIIELDINDPLKQIRDIISNYSDYIPLIEQNYDYVKTHHTWGNRWDKMNEILQ